VKSDENRTYIDNFVLISHPKVQEIKQTIYDKGPVIALINDAGFDFLFYRLV
jgi:hypothetical protein